MSLHHTREIANMRSAYDQDLQHRRIRHDRSDSGSSRSYQESRSSSGKSYETAQTEYSRSSVKRSPHIHYLTREGSNEERVQRFFDDRQQQESPRSSVETYASTVQTEKELQEDLPEYEVPAYIPQPYQSSVLPATPQDFSELFPSDRRLFIRHDDSTLDGNMNLRIDTAVSLHGRDCDMTLFHLRMHDLRNREFSLRRYCRDSGREVCHSSCKEQQPAAAKRPSFQRSLSNALSSMRPKSNSKTPTLANLQRNDSGYASMHSVDLERDDQSKSSAESSKQSESSDHIVKLEFSNYAQMNVKRAGSKGTKRYEFEYWGVNYAWRRATRQDRGLRQVSYVLAKQGSDQILAYIKPIPLTEAQASEEAGKGGWIPPCSMRILDQNIIQSQKDVSDAVIAAGLMALVDDSIRARFHSKSERSLLLPSLGVEYVGPKRLINEMFNRTGSTGNSRPSSSGKGSRRPVSGVGDAESRSTTSSFG